MNITEIYIQINTDTIIPPLRLENYTNAESQGARKTVMCGSDQYLGVLSMERDS